MIPGARNECEILNPNNSKMNGVLKAKSIITVPGGTYEEVSLNACTNFVNGSYEANSTIAVLIANAHNPFNPSTVLWEHNDTSGSWCVEIPSEWSGYCAMLAFYLFFINNGSTPVSVEYSCNYPTSCPKDTGVPGFAMIPAIFTLVAIFAILSYKKRNL